MALNTEVSSYLSEHEKPFDAGSDQSNYQPTPEEEATIKYAYRLFEKAKKARQKFDVNWTRFYKFFRGKQWEEQRPTYRHSEVFNMVFPTLQSSVAYQSDSRPKIEFVPQEPGDTEFVGILNDLVTNDWVRGNWLYKMIELLFDANIYGTMIGKVDYDQELNLGAGSVCFKTKDPLEIYPDPDALSTNERCSYIADAEAMPLEKLKAEYPQHKEFLQADLQDLYNYDKTSFDDVKFKSPTDVRVLSQAQTPDTGGGDNLALKITLWAKPNDYVEDEKELEDGSKEYVQKLKYPSGRKIVVANNVLLEDATIDFEDKKFPYFRGVNYLDQRNFWGISDIESLISPQKTFNKLVSFVLDYLTLMGNPIWVVDDNAGIDTDNLFNSPGIVVEKTAGSEVRREMGTPLQPYVLELIDKMRNWFNETQGATDVSRGIRPEAISSGIAIQSLQDAAHTRIRLKSKYLDAALQEFGQLYLSRVFQYYKVPRIVRVSPSENVHKYFKFHVEHRTDENGNQKKFAVVRKYDGSGKEEIEAKEYEFKQMFDVRVSTGSSLPFAKQELVEKSVQLFKLGVIDREELLRNLDYPNWESVLSRMEEKEAQLAQTQAMQQQGA